MGMKRNAPSCQAQKLLWGCDEPQAALELEQEPDFVLAADILYGPESNQDALVHAIKGLSGRDTLVVFASVNRPTVDSGNFFEKLTPNFDMKLLPQSLMHPTVR